MKRVSGLLTAIFMLFTFLILPGSTIAATDPFLDAGFIQARNKVPAVDFTLEDLNGKQIRLTDYRGKVVMLFFWTTW
jgi:cytochrome oxidase Cu insertion factor (SCO1/SenC/PrrC family)